MLVLGIETSTPVCGIALVENDVVCAHYTLDMGVHHSKHLFPMIERVLSDRGVGLADLDGVAVASGPGSFTGLRIGMASAKSLCFATDLPLIGVSTLAGMAFVQAGEGVPVCAMLDARRDQVYMGVYELVGEDFVAKVDDCAVGIADALPYLAGPVLLVGDGVWAHRDKIQSHLGGEAYVIPASIGHPQASGIGLLGAKRLAVGEKVDLDSFEPQYLRTSQAEQVRAARLAKETEA